VQLVTRNVADYYHLRDLGGIAPAKRPTWCWWKISVPSLPAGLGERELSWTTGSRWPARRPMPIPRAGQTFAIPRSVRNRLPCRRPPRRERSGPLRWRIHHNPEAAVRIRSHQGFWEGNPTRDLLKLAVFQRFDSRPRPLWASSRDRPPERAAATSMIWDATICSSSEPATGK